MDIRKPRKCYKCRMKCYTSCSYCGDPICLYHSTVDKLNHRCCTVCDIKFYKMWQQERDELHTTNEAYREWRLREENVAKLKALEEMEE